jgi:hypothetical protein
MLAMSSSAVLPVPRRADASDYAGVTFAGLGEASTVYFNTIA